MIYHNKDHSATGNATSVRYLSDLYGLPRWVAWKGIKRKGKIAKVPIDPKSGAFAKSDDPTTWATRNEALRLMKSGKADGVGVVLGDIHDGLHLVGIDLDSCIKDGVLSDWAEEIVYRLQTYSEISPSETGLKLLLLLRSSDRYEMGEKERIAFNKGEHCEIALDLGGRYYTVTGLPFSDLVGASFLRVVDLADLRWLVHVAGPAFAGRKKAARDESDSAELFRLARAVVGRGGNKIDFLAAIETNPRAAAHVAKEGKRAIDRAWERAQFPRQPSDDADIDEAIHELVGAPPADPITARLNKRFALARHAGRTLTVEFHRDGIHLGGVEDLHTWHARDLVPTPDGKRLEPASKHWLRDPRRREFSEIVFDPTGNAPKSALNLWTGFAVEPASDASCELILAHIRHVLANGNDAHSRYIIGWLADMVQNPGRKPDVALVLKGGKGAGKDTLAAVLRRIIGKRHVAHVTRPDALTQRFNAQFATALLCHVEEAFWSGAQDRKGTLQALITSETMPIEKKGVDTIEVESFLRLLMTTNETWAVPASNDERRYAVFDVSDDRRGDKSYFEALYAEITGGGPAGFLAYLLEVDLDDFNVRNVPQTDALTDQKLSTLRGAERWWFEFLHKGDIGDFQDWDESVSVERDGLRSRYESFIRENRHQGDAVNFRQFGVELRKLLPSLGETRPRQDGKSGRRMYVFPPLAKCRAEFASWLGATIDWGDE